MAVNHVPYGTLACHERAEAIYPILLTESKKISTLITYLGQEYIVTRRAILFGGDIFYNRKYAPCLNKCWAIPN